LRETLYSLSSSTMTSSSETSLMPSLWALPQVPSR
jgi:hypothetical protein